MLRHKSILFLKTFILPAVSLWLLYAVYHQTVQQPHLAESWRQMLDAFQSSQIFLLLTVVLLMAANWSIEAWKWQMAIATVMPVCFVQGLHAVLSGVSFSVALPNRIGEYAGRIMHLPDEVKLKSIPISVVGSISQLLVTLWAGFGGLLFLQAQLVQTTAMPAIAWRILCCGTGAAAILLLLIYFGFPYFSAQLSCWLQKSRYGAFVQPLRLFDASLLARLLSLSILRYAIFSLQYVLLFSFFKVNVAVPYVLAVTCVMFLIMSVLPTVALAELGWRGQVSLHLMGMFTENILGVLMTTVSIWAINLMLPALAGTVLLLKTIFLKRRHEKM